jgi:ABC-type phosphate transport system substrate-binding protein
MNRKALRISITFMGLLLGAMAAAGGEPYVVVVNPANHVSAIPRHVVSAMFMKRVPAWENGTPLVPVDHAGTSRLREVFCTAVHHKSLSAVRSYWQQQIFSGRDVPPLEKATDAEVIAFVKSNPGAISYVAAATPLEGLKTIKVTE